MTEIEMLRKQVADLMDRVRVLEMKPEPMPPVELRRYGPLRDTGNPPWYPPHEITCGPNKDVIRNDPLRIC